MTGSVEQRRVGRHVYMSVRVLLALVRLQGR